MYDMSIEWNRIEKGLPLESGRYLCVFSDRIIEVFDYDEFEDWKCGYWNGKREDHVTHWAFMPDGPEV